MEAKGRCFANHAVSMHGFVQSSNWLPTQE
jgi:hypothetical protein